MRTALEVEKILVQVLNQSNLPIETAYYLISNLANELKTMLLDRQLQQNASNEEEVNMTVPVEMQETATDDNKLDDKS